MHDTYHTAKPIYSNLKITLAVGACLKLEFENRQNECFPILGRLFCVASLKNDDHITLPKEYFGSHDLAILLEFVNKSMVPNIKILVSTYGFDNKEAEMNRRF